MKAKDIMTKRLITMTPKTNVLEAIDILVNNKISGAPVLNDNGLIAGVVTEKDLIVALDFLGKRNAKDVYVEEFMTKDIISFAPDAQIDNIMQVLVRKNVKRVPIVDSDRVVGVVSRRDILRSLRNK